MDIKEYSYLLAVVRHGSISEAAKELFISQPSLSLYLKNLEKRAGIRFFYKNEGKIFLTQEGKRYIEYARKISDLDTALMRELKEMRNLEAGEVVLGLTLTRGNFLAPLIWPAFHEKYPGITLKLVEANSEKLEEMIRNRRVDIAIISELKDKSTLERVALYDENICVTVPADDQVCEKAVHREGEQLKWLDLKELREYPFIFLKKGHRMRQIAEDLFRQIDFSPNVVCETASATTAYELSALGAGCSIITDTFCRRNEYLKRNVNYYLTGDPVFRRKVEAVYENEERLSRAAKALLEIIRGIDYMVAR